MKYLTTNWKSFNFETKLMTITLLISVTFSGAILFGELLLAVHELLTSL